MTSIYIYVGDYDDVMLIAHCNIWLSTWYRFAPEFTELILY